MTIAELNSKLDKALRAYIKKRKHILTGALYESVTYDCAWERDDLRIKFSSMYYIKFLEHGDFIQDFYNLSTTNDILSQFVAEMVEEDL